MDVSPAGVVNLTLDSRVIDKIDMEQVRQLALGAADYQSEFLARRPSIGTDFIFVGETNIGLMVEDGAVKITIGLDLRSQAHQGRRFDLYWTAELRWYEGMRVLLAEGQCLARLHGLVIVRRGVRVTTGEHITTQEARPFTHRLEAKELRSAVKMLLLTLERSAEQPLNGCVKKFEEEARRLRERASGTTTASKLN